MTNCFAGMPPSGNYQGQPGGTYNQPYGDQYGQQQYPGGPYPPTNRPMYPPYGAPEPDGYVHVYIIIIFLGKTQ